MYKYFKVELKRAVYSKNTLFAAVLVFILLVIPAYKESINPWPNEDGIDFFIRIGAYLPTSYLPLLAPIIACIPFSNSYILDKASGFSKYIYPKLEVKRYLTIKLLVNAIVSGVTLFIPQMIMLTILLIIRGINSNKIEMVGAFSIIYSNSKIAYILILLIVQFVFGAVFSTFALGISSINENKYLTIIIPFIYVIITGTVFEILGLNNIFNFNVVTLFDISYYAKMTISNVVIYDALLFSIGNALFYYFGMKRSYE